MRKLPPFCPVRNDKDYNVEECPVNKMLQLKLGKPDEFMCRTCIDENLDSNVK